MLALVSAVVPMVGVGGGLATVAVYAVAITGTMSAVGGGVGEVFSLLSGHRRAHASLELGTSALVFTFAVHVFLRANPPTLA